MGFRIGQEVVYVGKDLEFDPNPGKTVHVIQGMRKGICNCRPVLIDVGITTELIIDWCPDCGVEKLADSDIFWKSEFVFRPLIEGYTAAIIEQPDGTVELVLPINIKFV